MPAALHLKKASLHILVGYDVGFEIRLSQIPQLFDSRKPAPLRQSGPVNLARDTQPIRIAVDPVEIPLQKSLRKAEVFVTFYDLGAISLEFICEVSEDFSQLAALSEDIQNSHEIRRISQHLAKSVFESAKTAIVNADFFTTPSVFTVFNIQKLAEEMTAESLIQLAGSDISHTLKSSNEELGASEIARTLTPNITYSDHDVVFASSNVAMVFDETSSEVIDIFELANVQSLELRYLDAKLDRNLQALYESNEKSKSLSYYIWNIFESQGRKLNTIHLDTTIVAERVEQSYKFASDTYLVRIHELAVEKMFLTSFSRAIDRKLSAIRDIFIDQRDRASSLRMEILEWIIIALITIEVVPVLWGKFTF